MRILLIEDDRGLGCAVQEHLRQQGHAVDTVCSLDAAGDALRGVEYGLVLLDLRLPDGDGLTLLRAMRCRGDWRPTIVITSRDQVTDRISGLQAGADDYMVKPFDLGELTARVAAVARRATAHPDPEFRRGDVHLNVADRRAELAGEAIALTAREWAIVERLLQRPGAVVSRERIEEALYAFGAEIESNAVEVYISRIRRKLGAGFIRTLRGIGYRVEA